MNWQLKARLEGENRARLTLLRLLCAVSLWRTAMTRILPLCGAAAWWVTLLCLLPGLLVASLLRLTMHLTRTATLTEAFRVCLGRGGAMLAALALALLLAAESVMSITALITLFTEGLGTRGTQLTLAALTGGALLVSLHREGLARAAFLLRWLIAGAAVLLAFALARDAKLTCLFPVWGDGEASVLAAVKAGVSLAWPMALLLTAEAPDQGRLRSAVLPGFSAVAAVLLLTLTIPHELLVRQEGLAALLQLPTRYAPNALRVLAMCLMILTMFLAIGAAVQTTARVLCAPWKNSPRWLPGVLLAGAFLTQGMETNRLWAGLSAVGPWLLLPLALLAAICLPIALIRRERS